MIFSFRFVFMSWTIIRYYNQTYFQTFYPSHAFHGPSLLASYTWEKDAENVYAYSDKELMEKVESYKSQL